MFQAPGALVAVVVVIHALVRPIISTLLPIVAFILGIKQEPPPPPSTELIKVEETTSMSVVIHLMKLNSNFYINAKSCLHIFKKGKRIRENNNFASGIEQRSYGFRGGESLEKGKIESLLVDNHRRMYYMKLMFCFLEQGGPEKITSLL